MLNHLYSFYEELKEDGVMFCFSGPTSQSVLEGIGLTLRRKMEFEEAGTSTVQRIFSIFVEQVQNIINYSIERTPSETDCGNELRHGIVIVGRCNGKFYVLCGNKVSLSQSNELLERIKFLSTLNKDELREHYKDMRRRDPGENSKGAGLGFLEIFRRASEPPECHVAQIDAETVFFSVKAVG